MTLTPDLTKLVRAPQTQIKLDAIDASQSLPERVCFAIEKYFIENDLCFASFATVSAAAMDAMSAHSDTDIHPKAIEHAFNRFSTVFSNSKKIKGKKVRVRIFTKSVIEQYGEDGLKKLNTQRVKKWAAIPSTTADDVLADIKNLDQKALEAFIADELV